MGYAIRVTGKKKIRLGEIDPDEDGGLDHESAVNELDKLCRRMTELQELLYAASEQSLLIVLQGMDTSGKDGTIRAVTGPLNSQSCSVASFKVPTPLELSHDFLWRVHSQVPARGQIVIFNRSHYEDVLVARVHELAPKKVWRTRYEHINAFENLLLNSNTIILKFFLHISKGEQEKRLLEREQDPKKAWKLSVGDWKERQLWNEYQQAYEDAINKCATPDAPWYVVPANNKHYRNVAVAQAIVAALKPFEETWLKKLSKLGEEEKKLLLEFRAK